MIRICQPVNKKEQELVEDSDVQRDKHLLNHKSFSAKNIMWKFCGLLYPQNSEPGSAKLVDSLRNKATSAFYLPSG